jgi:NADH dehydrogenase [ubiquinone] 1 alpha subcomplex assembly factor 6
LQKWNDGINSLFDDDSDRWQNDATLRLLHHVMEKHTLSKQHFDRILLARQMDVDMKQYPTLDDLVDHVEMSCGSLLYLVLECANIHQKDLENEDIYKAAKHIGITHGLSNALRLSIPKASSTGKVIIPQDLCDKYKIKSPRYLLSALGMGDEECRQNLQKAVGDIVDLSRDHLSSARMIRDKILAHPRSGDALSAFLPALASETFMKRLERHHFDLTDRQLRSVGIVEHLACTQRIMLASFRKIY